MTEWKLTKREQDVMRMMCNDGKGSSKEVARRLGLSDRTVEIYVQRARAKMGAVTRLHAALMWDRSQRVETSL